MFQDMKLESVYFSKDKNIPLEFYNPVLMEARTFDRVSAYFSSGVLAYCAEGLEYFRSNGRVCRIIVSKDISEEDYNSIVKGYELKESVLNELCESFSAPVSDKEEQNLSNLAYLIATGVVEIKIAFVKRGIFHYKFGIYTDDNNDIIFSMGSDNWTVGAYEDNNESLSITCSWQCSPFDYEKIRKHQERFDELWNNKSDEAYVVAPSDRLMRQILSYNKGGIIIDKVLLQKNSFVLDYEKGRLIGYNHLSEDNMDLKVLFRVYLDDYIEEINGKQVVFNPNYGYLKFKQIIGLFENYAPNINLLQTDRLIKYLKDKELHIKERADLGKLIKNRDVSLQNRLDSFNGYITDSMSRILRKEQLWDAFYMWSMKKSSNFSVPGSGKTTSALAVLARLQETGEVDRVLVISPINAFQSWVDEFHSCFDGKQDLRCFNVQQGNLSTFEKKYKISHNKSKYNLMLFNYESLGPYINELSKLVTDKTLLIFDEVHKVKAVNGVWAQNALKVAKNANYVITMTGTPIPNSYLDIYNNLHLLFPEEYNDYFAFSTTFLENAKGEDIDRINEAIYPFFCRTSKDDLGVPPANDNIFIKTNTNDYEKKIFHILRSKYKSNKFALIVRLLQLETDASLLLEKLDIRDFKNIFDIDAIAENLDYIDKSDDLLNAIKAAPKVSSKLAACLQLVKELHSQHKPVIIWTIFVRSMQRLFEQLQQLNIKAKIVSGDVPPEERVKVLNEFKAGEFDVLITNPHTLAESVSLHSVCHDTIYYEYSYNLVHLLQSKDRIHRLGLPKNQYTQYYYIQDIFTDGKKTYSLDETIYERLNLKEQRMLEAVRKKQLEPTFAATTAEDIDAIFKILGI